jgi:hypothetical protein
MITFSPFFKRESESLRSKKVFEMCRQPSREKKIKRNRKNRSNRDTIKRESWSPSKRKKRADTQEKRKESVKYKCNKKPQERVREKLYIQKDKKVKVNKIQIKKAS